MKTLHKILIVAATLLAVACSSDKNDKRNLSVYDATVTFRPQADGSYYLKQDDTTALVVLNEALKKYPFKGEKRALVQYVVDNDAVTTNKVEGYKTTRDVTLVYIDTTYTKAPVVYDSAKDASYGLAPVTILSGKDYFPTTMVEDGYLCVFFKMMYGNDEVKHEINLLTGTNPSDPYEVEFRHNSNKDDAENTGLYFVCFPLKDLPSTAGKTVTLTLKYKDLASGETKTLGLDYCSRTDW